jgi:hypothetical protein
MIKVYYMRVWLYHSETPPIVQLICANEKDTSFNSSVFNPHENLIILIR